MNFIELFPGNTRRLIPGFVLLFFLFILAQAEAQVKLPVYASSTFSTYYHQRVTQFENLPRKTNQIVFLGNSITDGGEWSELFRDPDLQNRGISGDVTAGVLNRLPLALRDKPRKIFLLIGVNDLAKGVSVDSVFKNISLIGAYVRQESPATSLFVQSLLPVNPSFGAFGSHMSKVPLIRQLNVRLQQAAASSGYTFLNFYPEFCDPDGRMKAGFTNDGLHLMGDGYAFWKHLLYPYVYDLEKDASIIPRPLSQQAKSGVFPIYKLQTIFYTDSLRREALFLQELLGNVGIYARLQSGHPRNETQAVVLDQQTTASQGPGRSGYQLSVDPDRITISAPSRAGVFYGIQTLRQLLRDGSFVPAQEIRDSAAFQWRGYMVDVARNYQSPALLKQQIDQMAAYKLNVFHMHLTEDIAWRLQIKQYPQLTSPENMLRNKGMYYTEAELKDLIAYCKERHIRFLPEIDMPGHSDAFKRAMGVDMQSDSGMVILKNILKEFCETYDVDYIHIGADEVKIKNLKFIPEMTAFLRSMNKQVVGWEPGGNFDASTIRQLWMDDAGLTGGKTKIQYIDSRHLYVNHMDPLEGPVTIFARQLCDVNSGNTEALGATLCVWPDRAVAKEEDVIRMNAVFPLMVAFGERAWRGGGEQGWVANMGLHGAKGLEAYAEFERRLLDHKQQYFKTLSFPYQKQAGLKWKLYGPFKNDGDLSKIFAPEKSSFDPERVKPQETAIGGTIVLRHWWAPKIQGVLSKPAENTTWYAVTRIWSVQDTVKNFWVGFGNLSRSQATDTPMPGTWDNHHSAVWLNGRLVAPPQWLHAGQPGNLEIPLIDEGYEYRAPMRLKLVKGWNTVKIKAPIGAFQAKNWNNPEKWMFTFVECDPGR